MAERRFRCKEKCYYLCRLWYPARVGVAADELTTDRTDVDLRYFELIEGRSTARKRSPRIKDAGQLPKPPRNKKTGEEATLEDLL